MRPLLPLLAVALVGGCQSSTTPAIPPTVAIVNRSGQAYVFGVADFTGPTTSHADTLTHSTGSDSVCVAMPAAGDDYLVFFGIPADTADAHLIGPVFQGSLSAGWLLFYGKVGADTVDSLVVAADASC